MPELRGSLATPGERGDFPSRGRSRTTLHVCLRTMLASPVMCGRASFDDDKSYRLNAAARASHATGSFSEVSSVR